MLRITALATMSCLAIAVPAAADSGSPFNGHFDGRSLNGRHNVDVNINGGRVRTANLKLDCGLRTVFADFPLDDRVSSRGRFIAKARSSKASVRGGASVKLAGRVSGARLTGTLTATAGSCKVGPVRFSLRRAGE